MRKNNIIKSVSFNDTNPDDRKMLKYIKRRNFSGYMKKLLMADIEAREQSTTQNNSVATQSEAKVKEQHEPELSHIVTPQEVELSTAEKLEQMRRQSKKTGNGASQPKSFINHQ